MDFNILKSGFQFTSPQRRGIFLLLTIIVVIQTIYFAVSFTGSEQDTSEKQEWLSVQKEIDSLKLVKENLSLIQQTYNPNFINDFKGYSLGMTTQEIDRLLAFRKMNKYVDSAKEFQKITQISDSLLEILSPQFKFPDWVKNKEKKKDNPLFFENKKEKKIAVMDINNATKADLMRAYGIGISLSERILRQRKALSVFVDMEQLNDIWGLSPEVIENLNKHFKIIEYPYIKKININTASIQELAAFPYFSYALAKEIVTYRSMNNRIQDVNDLVKIDKFPVDKLKIISLYLEL